MIRAKYYFKIKYNQILYVSLFDVVDGSFYLFKEKCIENIIKLNYHPNITPHNINDKLSKLLAFV